MKELSEIAAHNAMLACFNFCHSKESSNWTEYIPFEGYFHFYQIQRRKSAYTSDRREISISAID
jgi:hypothetical protein